MIIHRVPKQLLQRLADHIGAKQIKRSGLNKPIEQIADCVGHARRVISIDRAEQVRFEKGSGNPAAAILVGASTPEIAGERLRIAKDAASSVQAAIKGGIVPGGGTLELALSRLLEYWRSQVVGMEGYGVDAVISALQRPMAQMILNAGYNPLEKLDAVKAEQSRLKSDSIGLDLDDGMIKDLMVMGVVDPALVKHYAIKAAGEVAESILRINTIIKMRQSADEG